MTTSRLSLHIFRCLLLILLFRVELQAQIDSTSEWRTISGCKLCETTLSELTKKAESLTATNVEEMNLGKNCIATDGRFINGHGYTSPTYPGMIFQTDDTHENISKIRLTKSFNGQLPDGRSVKLSSLTLKDILTWYPSLRNTWRSRPCSDYWHFNTSSITFFVRINKLIQPQFPINEAYYLDQPIEGIDIVANCYQRPVQRHQTEQKNVVYFVDSTIVAYSELGKYSPDSIFSIDVIKNANIIHDHGYIDKEALIYITTKSFMWNKTWSTLSTISQAYRTLVTGPSMAPNQLYIINNAKTSKDPLEELHKALSAANLRIV